jgi:hypothetical protein
MSHTPTPWHTGTGPAARIVYEQTGAAVCDAKTFHGKHEREVAEANASLIVRAVNAHDALVESVEDLVRYCGDLELGKRLEAILDRADATLKLARGDR